MRFDGLLPRTLLILIGLFGMTILVMAGFQSWTIDQTLTTEFRKHGKDLAESIASFSIDLVVNQDPTAIQTMIDERREGIPGISYILVLDEQGDAIAHTFVPSVPDELLRLKCNPLSTTFRRIRVKGLGDSINVCSAILTGEGGYVHVGMDREPIRILIWQKIWQMAGLMTLLFFISAGTTIALLRRVTLPLRQLTESAQRLAFGDALTNGESPSLLSRFPDYNGRDEVTELARAFRRMAIEVSSRETGLKELKELLKLLLDSTAEGIYGVDLEGNCTFCNSASVKLLGYERPEDLLGHNMHNRMHHTRHNCSPYPQSECFIDQAARYGKGTHTDDEVFWRADGTSFPVEIWSNPIRKNGGIAGCVVSFLDITERKRTADELDRYFNHTPNMMLVAGFDGYIQQANPAVLHAGGWTSIDEVKAEPFLNFIHPADRERVSSNVQLLLEGGSTQDFEARSRYHGDSYHWYSWSATSFPDRQLIFATAQDVTERKIAEESLRLNAAAIEAAANGIAISDVHGTLKWVNPAFTKLTGYSAAEAIGQNPRVLKSGRQTPEFYVQMWKTITAGQMWHGELVNKRKDGGLYDEEMTITPVRDATGDIMHFVAIKQDISERKRAEEDRQRLASLVENSTDFIALATLSEEVFYVNGAGRDLVELDPSRQTATSISDYYTEAGQRVMRDVVLPEVKTTGHWRGEIEFRDFRTGRPIDTDSSVFLIRHPKSGEPLSLATVTRDITEFKQAEQQLHQAKTVAEAANRAKSEFLANMSHEIRTPMNGNIGLTGLALDTELVPEQRQYLEGVMLSAESLLKLINSILDFSKIEAGKLELERTDFDLRATLENAIKTLAQRAFEKQLELLYEVRPDVPDALIGDPARLWQVIINLVGNALKFTQKGEITVLVELESQDEAAATLQFTVSDTGVGIPADKQGKLFQPFVQADNSTTRKYGGTGLGLVIAARLVDLMGGRAWFESEEGRGSRFHFTARFDRQPAHAAKDVRPQPVDVAGLHVLIVDDNATNRRIQRDQLTLWGMIPTEVESGQAALEILQTAIDARQPFDLLLLDVMMPEMDGFAVLERIHAMPDMDRPAILMLSSAGQKEEAARARDLGAAAYLIKPIRPTELLGAIETAQVLARQQALKRRESDPAKSVEPMRHPLHILVAEDNAVNQLLAKRTLEKAGHAVVVANNGEQAVAALGCDAFDLVLMDVQMPVMDGFQATARIRELEIVSGKHQQIVAMTAHALKGDRERCLAAGMDGYVTKPIRNSELFAAIATAVKDNRVPTVANGEV